jgi:peptide/nickel transport system substrate-binding protein
VNKFQAFLMTAAAVAVVAGPAMAATPAGVVVMAKTIDDIVSLDPAETYETSGIEVDANVYDRLVKLDLKTGEVLTALADSWKVSDDKTQYTFHIRPGVKFQSGNPVSADDVVYSLQRMIILNKTPAFILKQFGFTADNLKDTIRKIDDQNVQITVSKAFSPTFVLNCFASTAAAIVDSKQVKAHETNNDWGNGWLRANSAGSGAYSIRSYTANEQVTLDANANWYMGAPKNKRVILRHVPEPASQRLLLTKGDVDVARNLSKDQLEGVSTDSNVKIAQGDKGYIMYLGLNQKNSNLQKPEVWEALKWLVDYQSIEKNILAGTYRQHQTFLPNGFLGAVDDQPYKLDVDKAKALLKEAGLDGGFKLTMDVRTTSPWPDVAQALQASFAKAGVQLDLVPGDYRAVLTKYRNRQHDIYLGFWAPDYIDPHSNAEAFASNLDNSDDTQATKTVAWRNAWAIPELTKATQAAVMEPDTEKRKAEYADLQRQLLKSSPFVVMFQQVEAVAERANVQGYVIGAGGAETNLYATISKD